MQVGIYQANGVKENGEWHNATEEVKIDMGQVGAWSIDLVSAGRSLFHTLTCSLSLH